MGQSAATPSDETLRYLLDVAPDAIAIVRGPVIVYMSPAGARILGYDSPQELIGKQMSDWLHPDDVQVAGERIGAMMHSGIPMDMAQEYRAKRRDGKDIVTEVASVPITYEGEPAVLAFVRDVTERKVLEREVANSARLASLGQLSAGVAHELNNPLTHLMLAVEALQRVVAGALRTQDASALNKVGESLEHIAAEIARMSIITRELQLFASPQTRPHAPVELPETLDYALRTVSCPDGVMLDRQFCAATPAAKADRDRLTQVFANLLRNAFDSLEEHEVAQRRVIVRTRQCDSDRVAVDIEDNGPGIPGEVRERIFEPFFTTKKFGKGTGLGLAISRKIVQALGGSLEAHVGQEGGTVFTVTLQKWTDRRPAARGTTDPLLPSMNLLVVDDEPGIRSALARLLSSQHNVVIAGSGAEAIKAIERGSSPFDAIICDVMMPEMDGIELHRYLDAHHPDAAGKMMFMTGSNLGTIPELDPDSALVLRKPFSVEDVQRALDILRSRS